MLGRPPFLRPSGNRRQNTFKFPPKPDKNPSSMTESQSSVSAHSRPAIQVRDIRREFRSAKKSEGKGSFFKFLLKPEYVTHQALKGVNFEIESGAFVGLIGANGAGKTTLLKILAGLIPPSSGQARVLGIDPFTRPLLFRHQISLVMGQKAQLWWDLPATDAFELLRAIYQIPTAVYKDRLGHLSQLLDVTKHLHTQIRRLSLGERMKMELIGALIHWPKVVFLDEPTIGLDVLAAHKLREFLRVFNREEKATIILTSHNMEDIERLCSRVLIIRAGELMYDGAPAKLTRGGESQLRVRMMETPSIDELAGLTGLPVKSISRADTSGGESDEEGDAGGDDAAAHLPFLFSVNREGIVPVLQALMSKFKIIDMGIEESSLEKVIQRLYEENA